MSSADPHTLLPLACTLGPQDGRDRLERWRALHHATAPVTSLREGVLEVRYPDTAGVLDEVRALASAEQTCCGFVTWHVSQAGRDVVLTVRAPAGTPEAIEPIAALFAART